MAAIGFTIAGVPAVPLLSVLIFISSLIPVGPPIIWGGAAWIEVRDRGKGVPKEELTRIFEPFYRLPGHAEMAGGVGLGLSLVKQIAERHGGRVRLSSVEPQGLRVELLLPTLGVVSS